MDLIKKYFHLALGYKWCDKHGESYGDLFDECISCSAEKGDAFMEEYFD